MKITKELAEKQCRKSLERYRFAGITKVRIIATNVSCPSCKQRAGVYPIDKVPPIPNPECTYPIKKVGLPKEQANEHGGWCRCCYAPVVIDI